MNKFILDYTGTVLISPSSIENLWIDTNYCSSSIRVKCKGIPEKQIMVFSEEKEARILFKRILGFLSVDDRSRFLDLSE